MSFKRLIRFIATDNQTYFGEAILRANQDPRFATQASVIVGDIFGNYVITNEVKSVKKLLSPIAPEQVRSIRLIGMNYTKHALEIGASIPKYPVVFYKPVTALGNPTDPIVVPKFAQVLDDKRHDIQVDYETELVIVIGKKGVNIPKAKVFDHILGYTIGNDVSQRTWQLPRGGSQFSVGKMFDSWAPVGPAIVSPEVITNPNGLKIESVINGETRQSSDTSDMIFDVVNTVHYLSQGTTLMPGDLIFTGTPSGVAAGMKSPKWLKNNDTCICRIEQIGSIENKVVFEKNGYRDFKL